MSLFPAYSHEDKPEQQPATIPTETHTGTEAKWLENQSFDIAAEHLNNQASNAKISDTTDSEVQTTADVVPSKKRKKSKKSRDEKHVILKHNKIALEFTGSEEFYIDKKSAPQYNTIKTLHKPACPRYRVHCKSLGKYFRDHAKHKEKRYYRYKDRSEQGDEKELSNKYPLDENEFTAKTGELNTKTLDNPKDLNAWLELISLQDRSPYKLSKLRIAEKKLDYIEKALMHHAKNDQLYQVYINIITQCYTSHDVSKMLEAMLKTDSNSFLLWQSLIMCTQGTMARCTIPDVLQLYERCMKKMFHRVKQLQFPNVASDILNAQTSDEIMMKLFYNCCLFLRQSGLYEQFFALIKLAVELNVTQCSYVLDDLQPRPEDDQTLIEYEELILQSGLPMNELWLRVEKLRQSFNFLPYPGDTQKCPDPQRIVFNEDVCHYVYPLKCNENAFKLLLLIVKLLKIPFICTDSLHKEFDFGGDTDAIEDHFGFLLNDHDDKTNIEFCESLYELAKEMSSTPTYLSTSLAYTNYSQCLRKFLINCSRAFEQIDERKRVIFLLIWCRFERLLLLLEKFNKKLTPEYIKQGKHRFKSLLKQKNNRNNLLIYVELALYEKDCGSGGDDDVQTTVENIYKNLIEIHNNEEHLKSELAYVYLMYAKSLLASKDTEKLSQLLSAYVLKCKMDAVTNNCKLKAIKQLKESLQQTINIEKNVEIMIMEQYFLPDFTIIQIEIYSLFLCSLQQKQQALEYIQKLLETFKDHKNKRHRFLREKIYAFYITILQLHGYNSYVSQSLIAKSIYNGIENYPNNLYLLQKWSCLSCTPWYKIKAGLLKLNPTIKCVVLLITLARCRFIKALTSSQRTSADYNLINIVLPSSDVSYHETLVRQRILNLFTMLTKDSSSTSYQFSAAESLQRNSLFWRLYLRCLSDQNCSFELSKKCLLTALDECPWSKSLYLDGATYVPQELSHLQDLIIEKQLRIYALPEELEILRQQ